MRVPHECSVDCQVEPLAHFPVEDPAIDLDRQRKERIAQWICDYLEPRYEDGVDENDLEEVLLAFENFLGECETRRMRD